MARIALAQINSVVGDLQGNARKIEEFVDLARHGGAQVVAFPELAVTGYPPEDLVLKKSFVADNISSVSAIAQKCKAIAAVVGFVDEEDGILYNGAAFIEDGEVRGVYRKQNLPNYGVFDERRYFAPGADITLATVAGLEFGITICEDIWTDTGPHVACALAGAKAIININASPYHIDKRRQREDLLRRRGRENNVAIAYVNAVGGQDELVFDGHSMAVGAGGDLSARAAQFKEDLLVFDIETDGSVAGSHFPTEELEGLAEVWSALTTGVADYLEKNGFREALVGISGGIDSALTAAIAVDALGPSRVLGVFNPSVYTSDRSFRDADKLAKNLGIELLTLPIDDTFDAARKTLAEQIGLSGGPVEENLQARIRGIIWMAISNQTGRIVLSTGNKSELAVGYATLYGDMTGGLAVLKDVSKTLVYDLAAWRNKNGPVIPASILEREPTAELRPNQLDTDSLPPYEVLDPILAAYVERDLSLDQIQRLGYDRAVVAQVIGMVDKSEYKRRQAPPGIKITERAFGRDRRMPITNRYQPS